MSSASLVGDVRPSDVLALALVVGTFAVGVVAYGVVPADVMVHYTPPGGVYYGPETLPKSVGLFVVPVVTAVTFAALRVLPSVFELNGELAAVLPYYRLGLALLVAVLASVQVALVLSNVR